MPLVVEQGDTLKGKVSREVGALRVGQGCGVGPACPAVLMGVGVEGGRASTLPLEHCGMPTVPWPYRSPLLSPT